MSISIRQSLQAQKYVQYFKSKKKAKIRMGATRQSLKAQPKILKKSSKHQINQSEQTFSQKNTKSTNQDANFSKKKYA
jgi:hypothetical protein